MGSFPRVFCNVWAYVSCRGYDGILQSAHFVNQGGTADITVLESLTFKTVFLIIRGNYMYYPSLEMLEKLDLKSYDLVPIKKEIYSDMITPIELMRKLKQYSKHVYMLESHEDKTKWGRYTFIGFDPKSEITCYNKMMKVDDKIFKVTHPKEYIRKVKIRRFSYFYRRLSWLF